MEKCRKRPRRLFHLGYALKQVCGDRRSAAIDTRHRWLFLYLYMCGNESAVRDTVQQETPTAVSLQLWVTSSLWWQIRCKSSRPKLFHHFCSRQRDYGDRRSTANDTDYCFVTLMGNNESVVTDAVQQDTTIAGLLRVCLAECLKWQNQLFHIDPHSPSRISATTDICLLCHLR